MKNTAAFVIGALIAAWCLNDLMAPGELHNTGATILNIVGFLAGAAAAVGAIMIKVRGNTPKI